MVLKFTDIMSNYGIQYSVVVNLENELIETFGNTKMLEYKDLVNQLFGDIEKIKSLDSSLEGQLMPRTWCQGKVTCIVCKPKANLIIGLFYNEDRPFMESIKFTKEIDKVILESFNTN